MTRRMRSVVRWLSASVGVAVGAYVTYVGVTWARYGHPPHPSSEEEDEALDLFIPGYEVVERHHIRVGAPAEITFSAACDADLMESPIIRAVFTARETILGSRSEPTTRPRGLLALTKSLGWGVLAEMPNHEVVMGAVTQPWQANPVFRALPPSEFAAFDDPGYVKIAWTLRADRVGANESVFRTETRVIATDTAARTKFRRYWSFLSPGIAVIRRMMLGPLKTEAERRAHAEFRSTSPGVGVTEG
jgi:hypothetical protein